MYIQKVAESSEDCAHIVQLVQNSEFLAFDTESSGPAVRLYKGRLGMLNVPLSTMTGFSLCDDKEAWYVPVRHRLGNNAPTVSARQILSEISKTEATVFAHNWKHDARVLELEGYSVPANCFDTMVAAWLIRHKQEGKARYGLKALAKSLLGHQMEMFEDVVKKATGFDELAPAECYSYAIEDAIYTFELGQKFLQSFKYEQQMRDWFYEVEMPCVWVLKEMEDNGLRVDDFKLLELADTLDEELAQIVAEWRELAPDVEIGSPKQIAEHFYGNKIWDSKRIPVGKNGLPSVGQEYINWQLDRCEKGSLGYRCAELKGEFWKRNKLRSTYTTNLVQMAGQYPDGRLHSSFNQTGTETGRFSSSQPNLQNIPRQGMGILIRNTVIPADGKVFICADYSQIELRVLAHMVGEGEFFTAYRDGRDIHQETGDAVGLDRQGGKLVNFSLVYGAHANKLAKIVGVSKAKAKEVLKKYHETYPEIGRFKRETIEFVSQNGYVSTISGRIRQFPQLTQTGLDQFKRWGYEREAVNTRVQGSAADIMKKAMVDLQEQFRQDCRDIYMVAQVHDEILIECPTMWAEPVQQRVVHTMESAWQLRVPLKVESSIGKTWGEAK